jgi:subtilisin family serine protease
MAQHESSRRGVSAIVAVLAAVAIGFAVSNSALAVDQPEHPSKAKTTKVVPKNKVDPKNAIKIDPKNAARLNAKNAATAATNGNQLRLGANANQLRSATTGNINQRQLLRANSGRTPFEQRRFAAERARFMVVHRQAIVATRLRLPQRPMIGERGFTGVPPMDERRFVSSEMMFHVGANVPRAQVEAIAARHGMSIVGTQSSEITGGTIYICRADRGQQVVDAVRAMEAENIGVAQPNYVFRLTQDTTTEADKTAEPDETTLQQDLAARTASGDPGQYVVGKLHLGQVHRLATGSNVLVAVIDSQIDTRHPDLAGTIVEEFDAVGHADNPDTHGTGMVGAIVAQRKLMGVAPGSKILAIHAFSTDGKEGAQATTKHILAGIDWAIKKGARVINMSFAGPYDPMLQLAMKKARDQGVVLIAAAGNAGPKSPPLYPAADPNVIGVTATDENDKLFSGANQGPQVAVAAPGVNILEPAPGGAYQVTTGTSVAAAHVSGVAALLLEKNPALKPDAVFEILTSSAHALGPNGRDDQFGWGLIDPEKAVLAADETVTSAPVAPPAAKPPKTSTLKPGPAAVSTR